MGDVAKDDLRDVRDTILEEMRAGFRGVHERQDLTNGRIGQAEISLGRHDVRLVNMEREVFHRRAADRAPSASAARRISDRDVKIVIATIGATATVGTAIFKVLPILLKAVLP